MFELPESKRVRRDEILSPRSPSSPQISPVDNDDAYSRLGKLLGFDTFTIENNNNDGYANAGKNPDGRPEDSEPSKKEEEEEEDQEQEFEFRLFNAPKNANATTNKKRKTGEDGENTGSEIITTQKLKIRLRSPTPGDAQLGDGRLVVPFRGWQYYFTEPELMQLPHDEEQARTATKRREEYEDVAVTGTQLLEWARGTKTPGCHLPWRVIHIKPVDHRVPKSVAAAITASSSSLAEEKERGKKKSKPGKKRRIILRSRAAASATAASMTDAEKRNKKNREKKIRKRQRERERKAALAASAVSTEGAVQE